MKLEIVSSALVLGLSVLFKDIFTNMFAGVWIFISQEFKKGDHVKLDQWEGKIISITFRNVHIELADGSTLIKESSDFLNADVVRRREEET